MLQNLSVWILSGYTCTTLQKQRMDKKHNRSQRNPKLAQDVQQQSHVPAQCGQEHLGHSPELPTRLQSQIHPLGLGCSGKEARAPLLPAPSAEPPRHTRRAPSPLPPCCSLPFCLFPPKQQFCSTGFLKMFSNIFPKTQLMEHTDLLPSAAAFILLQSVPV